MMDVVVRTADDPAKMVGLVRDAIQSLDKSVAKFNVTTVDAALEQQMAERTFTTLLVTTFAGAALFLSAIGIYGLLHQLVVQRTSEMAVRMAMGAKPSMVQALVLSHGIKLAASGGVIGLAGAMSLSRFLSKLLYEVTPVDPAALAGALLLLIGIAIVSSWMPSARAARIDPMRVLRQE